MGCSVREDEGARLRRIQKLRGPSRTTTHGLSTFQPRIRGEIGAVYRLEYKANVNDPAWVSLPDTVTVTAIPQFYLDMSQAMSARRVYRAVRVD